jgi:hypothetical protein
MANINAIAPVKATAEECEFIKALWFAFLENYHAFRTRKMVPEDEVKFNLLSSPGPLQYSAFVQFFGHFKKEEKMFWKNRDFMFIYDLADMDRSEPIILKFLQYLCSDNYNPNGKSITMASGSFWREHLETRKKIIEGLKILHEKKAKVRIVTQARDNGEHISDLIPYLESNSHFNLSKRIPMHFMLADEDFLLFEFPHTESSAFRLNMFQDLNKLKLKPERTKADMLNFLETIVEGTL